MKRLLFILLLGLAGCQTLETDAELPEVRGNWIGSDDAAVQLPLTTDSLYLSLHSAGGIVTGTGHYRQYVGGLIREGSAVDVQGTVSLDAQGAGSVVDLRITASSGPRTFSGTLDGDVLRLTRNGWTDFTFYRQ